MKVLQKIFQPSNGNTKVVTVSATATTVALLGHGRTIRIVNNAGTGIYFQLTNATAAGSATVSDTPMLNGAVEVFERDTTDDTHISIRTFSGAGTGSVYVQTGEGS